LIIRPTVRSGSGCAFGLRITQEIQGIVKGSPTPELAIEDAERQRQHAVGIGGPHEASMRTKPQTGEKAVLIRTKARSGETPLPKPDARHVIAAGGVDVWSDGALACKWL
jgi:hypothetical protein